MSQRKEVLTRMAEERRKPGRGRGKPVVGPGDDDKSDVSSDFSSGSSTGSPAREDSGKNRILFDSHINTCRV